MKKINNTIILLTLLSIILGFNANCGKKTEEKPTADNQEQTKTAPGPQEKVILEIGDQKITNQAFQNYLHLQYPDLSITAVENNKRLLSRIFDKFVEHRIVLHMANQEEIAVDQLEFNHYMAKLRISSQDIDKKSMMDSIKVQKYLYYKVYDNIDVTDKEIADYYQENREEFQKKEQVLLYQILVKDKETALKIIGILKNDPQKFEEIARRESISMENQSGGLMGYFEKGQLPKDMESVVFSLTPNTISPVVESTYGCHIFKITKKKSARTLSLQNVQPEIKNRIMSEKLRNAYDQYIQQIQEQLKIVVHYDQLYFDYQRVQDVDTPPVEHSSADVSTEYEPDSEQ